MAARAKKETRVNYFIPLSFQHLLEKYTAFVGDMS